MRRTPEILQELGRIAGAYMALKLMAGFRAGWAAGKAGRAPDPVDPAALIEEARLDGAIRALSWVLGAEDRVSQATGSSMMDFSVQDGYATETRLSQQARAQAEEDAAAAADLAHQALKSAQRGG